MYIPSTALIVLIVLISTHVLILMSSCSMVITLDPNISAHWGTRSRSCKHRRKISSRKRLRSPLYSPPKTLNTSNRLMLIRSNAIRKATC